MPQLDNGETHVWRVSLGGHSADYERPDLHGFLSPEERERVRRFYSPKHGMRYAIAHAALRRVLGEYLARNPLELQFENGEHGKPELIDPSTRSRHALHFNLSHSGDLALIAVSHEGAVGVDVEQWRERIQPLEIAERFFSAHEQQSLFALPRDNPEHIQRGFFSTWSRKEAYLKATGHGISRGLHHFDVTVAQLHDEHDARLLADRLDPVAVERWTMHNLAVAPEYSAALVTTRRAGEDAGAIRLFDSPYM